ncbi:MAG: amidohydrolase family protein [bacterium]|nr:amidohydrolase family protein [bacterium]
MTSNKKTFYDIHCHAFNLSHANLSALFLRIGKDLLKTISQAIKKNLPKTVIIIALTIMIIRAIIINSAAPPCSRIALLSLIAKYRCLLITLLSLIAAIFAAYKIYKGIKTCYNALALSENDIGNYFLIIEEDVIKSSVKKSGEYTKMVITPLMMDFHYYYKPTVGLNVHYNQLPKKPISEQVIDVFNGIRYYRRNSAENFLQIYPFLGINPNNYGLDEKDRYVSGILTKKIKEEENIEIQENKKTGICTISFSDKAKEKDLEKVIKSACSKDQKTIQRLIHNLEKLGNRETTIKSLLKKHFETYEPNKKTFEEFFQKHFPEKEKDDKDKEEFDGSITKESMPFFFSGIKVYPPTGFDPWPDNDSLSERVRYIYQYACRKGIPITTHCTNGGFVIIGSHELEQYANPENSWTKVLAAYPSLKINFAHMGLNDRTINFQNPKKNWLETIINLMREYKYVYSDFSCKGFDSGFYQKLMKLLSGKDSTLLKNRILFGSDLMVNLFSVDSYQKYLEIFIKNNLSMPGTPPEDLHEQLCSTNPRNFLFEMNKKTSTCKSCEIIEKKKPILYDGCKTCNLFMERSPK